MKKKENKLIPDIFTVTKVSKNTNNVCTLEISPKDKKKLSFQPGQFNMLYVFGIGEIPISISGDTENNNLFSHTTKSFGVVSKTINKLKTGMNIGVRGPFGTSWPLKEAYKKDVFIIAGGIGIAPLRPVILELIKKRKKYGKITLIYGNRTPEDIIYKNELKLWSSKINVLITVSTANNNWKGNVGVITKLISQTEFNAGNSIAMICGPEIMMKFAIRELEKKGVKDENIFLSMERNMKCAVGFCGHCQFGAEFICKDGPIFSYNKIKNIFWLSEV